MARIRTIQPNFAHSATIMHLSRDARLLFIQLWTVVDDAGRSRASPAELAAQLYALDHDAPLLLPGWLDELEREGCIERYSVDGIDYLRVVNWRKHQKIDRPTPSRLPAAPREPLASPREESSSTPMASASEAIPREPSEITEAWVLGEVEAILRDAREDRQHRPALRAIELLGRRVGLWDHRQQYRLDTEFLVRHAWDKIETGDTSHWTARLLQDAGIAGAPNETPSLSSARRRSRPGPERSRRRQDADGRSGDLSG
jgi:hypothetical protein